MHPQILLRSRKKKGGATFKQGTSVQERKPLQQMFSCTSTSPLCFFWSCLPIPIHSTDESVYITGQSGIKMDIPVKEGGFDELAEARGLDYQYPRSKAVGQEEAGRIPEARRV